MNNSPSRITILGIGNTLYSDEGIGVYCIPFLQEIFANCEDIVIEDGSTDGMKLLSFVEESENLLIIDAINAGKEPGTFIRIEGEEIPKYFGVKMSIHQMGFAEVLAAAQFRDKYPKNIIMVGMQPYSLALSPEVTDQGKETAKLLIDEVKKIVASWRENGSN